MEELRRIGGIAETSTNTVLRTYKVRGSWSSKLLGERDGDLEPIGEEAAPDQRAPLDALDLELLQLVSEDGRRSDAELATAVGISAAKAVP